MRCNTLAVAVFLLLPATTWANDEHHDHHGMAKEAASSGDPPIEITINPEERVSVVLSGALPKPAPCGTNVDLPVKIVNLAFVTAQLEAQFVGAAPAGATLDFHPEPLRGVPEEFRSLHITLTNPGLTDLTIAFKAHNVSPDLGGRDRVHLLLRCLQSH